MHFCSHTSGIVQVRGLDGHYNLRLILISREPNEETDTLVPYLLLEAEEDRGICPEFLAEAVARFDEDDSIRPMLTKAVAGISYQLATMTMNDNYKPYVRVCI